MIFFTTIIVTGKTIKLNNYRAEKIALKTQPLSFLL